jgi:large subunit ribosomal protein L15
MTLKPHDLASAPGATKSPKRVGRGIGGKGGKTAGRGTKGQHARNTVARGFEGGQMPLKQRVPKLKGFTNPFRVEYSAVNLDTLEELAERFDARDDVRVVNPESLVTAGVVRPKVFVKVLARGLSDGVTVTNKFDVHAHAVSRAAEAAITAAGGTVTLIPLPFMANGKAGRPAAKGNQFTNR